MQKQELKQEIKQELTHYFTQLQVPHPDSHKGQNGKLLLIGGSELFHAASKWSLDVASKLVDMVFYTSVESNNKLIQQAKGEFWNGIVILRENLDAYVQEADCILIGPGMERNEETRELVNRLLQQYPDKKFVIDAGALQMVDPNFLNKNHIITPHLKEMAGLQEKLQETGLSLEQTQVTVVLKGKTDKISWFESAGQLQNQTANETQNKSSQLEKKQPGQLEHLEKRVQEIIGGNAGMTKGGTGDVLAGLIAGLYCTNKPYIAAVVGSYVNKAAGDTLHQSVGPFFNASDLVTQVPKTLWQCINSVETV